MYNTLGKYFTTFYNIALQDWLWIFKAKIHIRIFKYITFKNVIYGLILALKSKLDIFGWFYVHCVSEWTFLKVRIRISFFFRFNWITCERDWGLRDTWDFQQGMRFSEKSPPQTCFETVWLVLSDLLLSACMHDYRHGRGSRLLVSRPVILLGNVYAKFG